MIFIADRFLVAENESVKKITLISSFWENWFWKCQVAFFDSCVRACVRACVRVYVYVLKYLKFHLRIHFQR